MAKKRNRNWKNSTLLLTIHIGDGNGYIYKDKRPIREAVPPFLQYLNKGLQIDIPQEFIIKNGSAKTSRKTKPKPRKNGL